MLITAVILLPRGILSGRRQTLRGDKEWEKGKEKHDPPVVRESKRLGRQEGCTPRRCFCTLGAGSAVLLQTVPLGCPIQQLPQPNKLCERKDLEESEGWDESGVKSSPVWCDFTQGHSIDTISLFSSGWGRAERCQRRGLRPHRPQKCPRFLGGDPTEGCGQ